MLRRHRQLRTQFCQLKDSALFCIALWLAHGLRAAWDPKGYVEPFTAFLGLYVVLIPGVPLLLELQGFYNRPLIPRRRDTAWRLFRGCVATTMSLILVTFFLKESPARGVFLLFAPVSFILVFTSEEILRAYYQRRAANRQIRQKFVLVGATKDTEEFRSHARTLEHDGIDICGEVDLADYTVNQLIELLHEHSATGIIINARHTYFEQVEKAIHACELEGLEIWLLADFFKTKISRTTFDEFQGRPMLVFHSAPELSFQTVLKRMLDITGAMIFLLLFGWNLFLLFALMVRFSSPGAVLFRQKRCGLRGQPFTMYKFRTMFNDAEQRKHELEQLNEMKGPVFKVTNDPRVTKIGRILRKYSIDEWPQLFNVLRGEMSLVGPRPLPVDEVKRFDDLAHRRRLSVKPGLTCLWQVSGRNDVRDFRDWVRLDLEYIDNWSIWLDLKIICRTIPVVIIGTGAK
jgi:exopolysaccharide biosynthesis polyprenyl glycosylphosphotransferase